MTSATAPFEAAFNMQRQSIKQSQKLFEQNLDLQRNATEAFLRNSIAAQRSAQRQGSELARQLFDAQFDAFESTVDGNEYDVRKAIDQQFEDFDATQTDAWDEFEEDFFDAFEDLSNQQKMLVARSVEAFLSAQSEAEEQTVEGVQQAQQVAEISHQQAQQVTETAQQQVQETAEATQQVGKSAQSQLEDIEGLGSTYAERLREHDIESPTQLVQATAETVAEAAEVSEDEAEEWIEAAKYQT